MSNEKKSKSTRTDTIAKEKSTIRSLRQALKKSRAEIRRLKSELATLNSAFTKTKEFLKGSTEELAVEKLIDAAKNNKSLNNIRVKDIEEKQCPNCDEGELRTISARGFNLIICNKCKYNQKVIIEGDSE